jgi:hypothetical protein
MNLEINPFESNPGWDIIKALYSYYGLKDYIDFYYYDHFRRENILEIEAYNFDNEQGDKLFWTKVLMGSIIKGQRIRLKNFQISPWFPRKPGQYWTYDASEAREYALNRHIEKIGAGGIVLDVYGKTLMTELGGIGCVNFNKDRDYVLITATASGNTEEGIPIVCRKNIWSEIENEFQKQHLLEVDIDGTLVNINTMNSSFFLRSGGGVPRVAILVNSLLNIKFKASRLKIDVTPWTIFETKDKYSPYGFTFKTHTLFNDEITETNSWLTNYIDEHDGKTILTDYDEDLHYLRAVFPLNDITNGAILTNEIIGFTQQIYRNYKR